MIHNYLGVTYQTVENDGGIYHVKLGNVPVTGTTSQSPGEASMRFMLMLEAMQDMESKPMQKGDVLAYVNDQGETVMGLIDSLEHIDYLEGTTLKEIEEGEPNTIKGLRIRESIGDGDTNFRGPSSAYRENQNPFIVLNGLFITRPKVKYEWAGVAEVEFWAWETAPGSQNTFKYKRDVNVWKEVSDAN